MRSQKKYKLCIRHFKVNKWTKIKKNFTPDELNAISKKKYNTEYTVKPMPPLIRDYFKKKGAEYNQYRL